MTAPPDPFRGKAIALLLMAGAVAYSSAVNTGFVFDDVYWITATPYLSDPLAYLRASGDRTLVALTVLANYKLGGLNPLGYHAFNVAVHLAAGLTLFALLARALALPRWGGRFAGRETHLAFAAALLWTVHPLNTQAVTYVIQRAESMMGLFYLLTFYCWTRAATGPRPLLWQSLAAVSFLASCFSKEVAVTLPPVLLLYDRLLLASSWKQVFARSSGYLLLAGVWALKLFLVFGTAFGGGTTTGVGFGVPISKTQYALTQTEVILHYLRLAVWPVGQSVDYNGWPIANSLADVWPSAVALGAVLLASAALLHFRPPLGFLAAWFFLILAPTSSVMPIIDVAFEYRMYLSLVAVVVGVVLAADALAQRFVPARAIRLWAVGLPVLAAAALLTARTLDQSTAYRSEASFNAARRTDPNALSRRGQGVRVVNLSNEGKFAEAEAELLLLEAASPSNFVTAMARGHWHTLQGQYPQAIATYRTIDRTAITPVLLARADTLTARSQLASGDAAAAAETMRGVVSRVPDSEPNHALLAAVELAAGNRTAAAAARAEAERIDPRSSRTLADGARGVLFAKPIHPVARRGELEVVYWQAASACESASAEPEWFDTLAQLAARTGRFDEAVAASDRGVALAADKADERWKQALTDRRAMYAAKKVYGPTE